jgi:eukaryotic-like serine/threonine-protein kinase
MSDKQAASGPGSTSSPSNPSSRLDRINIGDIVAEKYRIAEVLGRGGMGLVVAAEHIQLQERVALKFLRLDTETPHEFQQRFVREAQVTAKLRGEHVARIRDFGVLEEGTPYMVMEFLEGTDLRKLLKQFGKLPVESALDYVMQACEGVAEAHAVGVVHRDLKPSNLYLTKRPDGSDLIKILDFGVAKMVQGTDHDELTAAGMLLGSPRYMSPEQLKGSKDIDARADIWSMGAIMYELLAGRAPFLAQTTAALCVKILSNEQPPPMSAERSDVPPELEAVILGCLERDFTKRIPDVAALAGRIADAMKLPWLEPAATRVAAVLERRAMQQTGTYSTVSSTQPRPGVIAAISAQQLTNPSGSARIDVAWTQSQQTSSRKRTFALLGAAAIVLIGGAALFAAFRHDTGSAAASTEPAVSSATQAPSAPPPASETAAPIASTAPSAAAPVASADSGGTAATTTAKKAPGPVGPVGPRKAPPEAKPPATPTATATSRPPVNPLDDRQ